MDSNRLKYYRDVLGIRFFPRHILTVPEVVAVTTPVYFWRENLSEKLNETPQVQCDLLFVSCLETEDEESLFQESHQSLFEKMKKAMGLDHTKTVVLEHVGSSSHDLFRDLLQMKVRVVVLLKKNPERSELKTCPEFKFIETHSPQTLSQNSQLKKEAWDDLQKIMKVFKN